MKPILIVQNDHHEGAGALATLIAERGLDQHSVLGSEADYAKLPSGAFGALVVLGGAQSAYETDKYPYLLGQMQLCRDFIAAGKPIAGFCLGAQILACAVGGEVVPGKRKEIGWYDLVLTEDGANDPMMQEHPRKLLSYHFHGDVIANVPDAARLAFSDPTANVSCSGTARLPTAFNITPRPITPCSRSCAATIATTWPPTVSTPRRSSPRVRCVCRRSSAIAGSCSSAGSTWPERGHSGFSSASIVRRS